MANDVSDRDAVPSLPAEGKDQMPLWPRVTAAFQRFRSRGQLGIALAVGIPCAVIGVDVFFIVSAMQQHKRARAGLDPAVMASVQQPAPQTDQLVPRVSATGVASVAEPSLEPFLDFDDGAFDNQASQPAHRKEKRFRTVRQAAAYSCSTSSVDGLSRQIVAQARCIDSNAFVRLPHRANLVAGSQVFPYLEAAAKEHLLRALDAHPQQTMTVHSALRTLAQQYLVWRWGAQKRCGVQLAARPGTSNHETGLALDIGEPAAWRSALEAENFRWFGPRDRVHFDYRGRGAHPHRHIDVMAFQQLWNLNHPDDAIAANGKYDSDTEKRLKKSPPAGFPIGAKCGGKRSAR